MNASLPFGQSARSASILVVDDEPDVADLFRQSFRREARQGTYVMHFATSGAEALDRLAEKIQPTLLAVLSDINMPGMDTRSGFVAAPICRQWRAGTRPSTLKLHVNRVIMSALGNCGRTATLRVRG